MARRSISRRAAGTPAEEAAAWKAVRDAQKRREADWLASNHTPQPPKIVCVDCERGPLTGVALKKKDGVFHCAADCPRRPAHG